MKKPGLPRLHSPLKTDVVAYRFSSGRAAALNPRNKKRPVAKLPTSLDELKVTLSGGCVFCDIGLLPNSAGLHHTEKGSVVCRKVKP